MLNVTEWLKSFGPVPPLAVPIPDTQVALGRKPDRRSTKRWAMVGSTLLKTARKP
jgi:hypothetical protein